MSPDAATAWVRILLITQDMGSRVPPDSHERPRSAMGAIGALPRLQPSRIQ
jgi:hypothetical protein